MNSNDSLVQIGKLSGQYEAMSGRIKALEGRVDQSDRIIIEKLESLQEDLHCAVVQLQKHSSVLDLHKRFLIGIAGFTGFGGAGGAAILTQLGFLQ